MLDSQPQHSPGNTHARTAPHGSSSSPEETGLRSCLQVGVRLGGKPRECDLLLTSGSHTPNPLRRHRAEAQGPGAGSCCEPHPRTTAWDLWVQRAAWTSGGGRPAGLLRSQHSARLRHREHKAWPGLPVYFSFLYVMDIEFSAIICNSHISC